MTAREILDQATRIVNDRITEIVGVVRMSSIEVRRSTAGKAEYTVKVYNADPEFAANKAREIEQRLAVEYGFAQVADTTPLFPKAGQRVEQGEELPADMDTGSLDVPVDGDDGTEDPFVME